MFNPVSRQFSRQFSSAPFSFLAWTLVDGGARGTVSLDSSSSLSPTFGLLTYFRIPIREDNTTNVKCAYASCTRLPCNPDESDFQIHPGNAWLLRHIQDGRGADRFLDERARRTNGVRTQHVNGSILSEPQTRSSTVDPLDQDILPYNPRTSRPARMWATTGSIPPYLQSGIPFGETLSYQRLQKLTETHSWGGYKVLAYTILSIVAHRARSKDASTVAQISLQFTYRITFPPNIAHGLPRRLNSS